MLKEVIVKAKSIEEATKKAIDKLDISNEYIFVEEKSKNEYRAFANVSLRLEGKKYLEAIFNSMGIEALMEIRTVSDNQIIFNITSNENAILIGKEGKNLAAFQYMLRLFLNQFVSGDVIITLDIGNYTKQRVKSLEWYAQKVAKDVLRNKTDIKLEPMNSFERRIIHTKIKDFKKLKSESEGFGKDRSVVVKYIG